MARHTEYDDIVQKLAEDYFNLARPTDDGEIIPSIEGIALYANIARSTIYEWIKDADKREFSDIIGRILEKQGVSLINNGLSGKYQQSIAKLMLAKHGYIEKKETDVTTGGDKLNINLVSFDANDSNPV